MTKWVCSVCGYVHEGDSAPDVCPICKAPAEKFQKQEGEMSWAAEHVLGTVRLCGQHGRWAGDGGSRASCCGTSPSLLWCPWASARR